MESIIYQNISIDYISCRIDQQRRKVEENGRTDKKDL